MSGITQGRLARHTPPGPQGRYAALIDIAQDLLLARLHEQGVFEHLVFKGGTALRKLYAGNAGRFSTDLDFSVREPSDDAVCRAAPCRDRRVPHRRIRLPRRGSSRVHAFTTRPPSETSAT